MRRVALATAAVVLALGGCDDLTAPTERPAQAPASSTFSHQPDADLSGYYLPVGEPQVGDVALRHLFVAAEPDFADWEAGERRYPPVALRLAGGRIVPTAYSVSEGRIRLEGRHDGLGAVEFDGRLDADALAQARRAIGSRAVVLTGTLKAGGQTHSGLRFTWSSGE